VYRLIRPLLFLLDAERAHHLVTRAFSWLMRVGPLRRWVLRRHQVRSKALAQTLFGVRFENPVGLAAGFDKDARLYPALAALGFGFIEVGTLTARPQAGNPRPRLFRLPRDHALINRFGFNNEGAAAAAARLATHPAPCPLGINIGRSKVVSNEDAADDYCESLRAIWRHADYITVNVSSPNTPELRALQASHHLDDLLARLGSELEAMAEQEGRAAPPLLVKIAPDLDDEDIVELCDTFRKRGVAAVIATNTTISRDHLSTPQDRVARLGAGGLSGPPLRARSLDVVKLLRAHLDQGIPIIAAGGILDASSAWEAITAGASLVQIYTGLVYRGPKLVREINRGLLAKLQEAGLDSLEGAVGRAAGGDPSSRAVA
jgi:dihydroorotate dehydrogenase